MLDFDKKARTADYNAEMKVIRGVTRWDRKRNEDLYKQSKIIMLPNVQVIKNKLRWCGHVMRREEESTLRVVMKLKMN